MHSLRRLVFSNRLFAGAVLALALMMKLSVPAGFMPTVSNGQMVISLCSGTGPMTMVMTVPGLKYGKSDSDRHQGKIEQPCAFLGLTTPSLAAADPVVLAAAILFVMALGMRALVLPASIVPFYLRPPLRAPPII